MSSAALRRRLFAALYDRLSRRSEVVVAPLRQRIVGRAHGAVLEIGAGTGANLSHYPPGVRVTVFETNPWMVARLRRKAAAAGREVHVDLGTSGALDLPYPNAQFDSVVATLVLCSVTDPAHVLAEIRRVLRTGGDFYFLEHVAASDARVRTWQRRLTPLQRFLADGCELDRDTASAIRNASFSSVDMETLEVPELPALTRYVALGAARA